MPCDEAWPPLTTLEKSPYSDKDLVQPKINT